MDDAERRRQYRKQPDVQERQKAHFEAWMGKDGAMGKMADFVKKWRAANPEKKRAHDAVDRAIRRGQLVRQGCESCGNWAEAHHEDYSKPLEVRWLCRKHHKEAHQDYSGQPSGTPVTP